MYHMGISISDLNEMDASEISWIYGWIRKYKEDEKKAIENGSRRR